MKEVVIISGKGGTGKTSFAASFAYLEKENAVIADCDVDAANMHLLLEADFRYQEDFYSGEIAVIDEENCINCGECKEVCRFDAIHVIDDQHRVDPISCEGCWYCSRICPVEAIDMKTQKVGDFYLSMTKAQSEMVHAKLGFAAENSGKLVAKVKNEAKKLTLANKKEFLIVDGSPGVGCPVISSLSGADLALLVTEATVSGLHDLKRVYKLVKSFNIEAACIINKYDLNIDVTKEIEAFLEEEDITLITKIAYDETFAKALSQAKTIIEYGDSSLKTEIEKSWQYIKNILRS
ncbi:(4Fe-4S)-binding protein [Sulfurimonas sp. CVO]|uniref:ATP-binding protein n=1 Tax=Sulfurimonas sp. CVO TaxID=2283483 RepID=UPI00132EED28|nr:ATP-binding protein [Sulfurimonas sp. CVO]QHG91962.1 (4Fe-4S)-binding protein [Sulfurimonas sp. CVO]